MNQQVNTIHSLLEQKRVLLMGILNVTPDSFYDGGRYVTESSILSRAEQILQEGADMIDVGAVSTRPGAQLCGEEMEMERIVKSVQIIRSHFHNAMISVDTFRAKVARVAIEHGANIINDISGGTFDDQMIATVGALQVPYVMMHTPAKPDVMQQCTQYEDIVATICSFFDQQIQKARKHNVQDIILDLGFGFGKTIEQNYFLLEHLAAFKSYGLPILVGISRKSMIYKKYNTTPENALQGTLEVTKTALQQGADILRVHDVAATKKLLEACS